MLVVHVVEKADGAPDKAGVQRREEYAEECFEAFAETSNHAAVSHDLRFAESIELINPDQSSPN